MDFSSVLQKEIAVVNAYLDTVLPKESEYPQELHRAMRYSVDAGGKRIRPILMRCVARAGGIDPDIVLPFAAALEMIHTYSLIHDDLPCMDNDDLRRGKPTNHKVFGEAKALLAGDALLTAAFSVAVRHSSLSAADTMECIRVLAEAAGPSGMVGGQFIDIDMEHDLQSRSSAVLEYIHSHKTGALIRVAAEIGAIAAGVGVRERERFVAYGTHLGKAFQIIDDILDVTGDSEAMGKTLGKDAAQEKFTYVWLYGVEKAQEKAREETDACYALLATMQCTTDELQALTRFLLERSF